MPMRVGSLIFIIAAIVLSAACGPKALPELVTGEAETGTPAYEAAAQGARFIVGPLPFGWRRFDYEGGATIGFSNRFHGQTIFVNVIYAPNRKAGLVALRNHMLFDLTSREIIEQETMDVDNREAIWTEVEGRLDGAKVKMALVVVRIDDWVYDMAYVAVPESYSICLPDFKKFVEDFHHQRKQSTTE